MQIVTEQLLAIHVHDKAILQMHKHPQSRKQGSFASCVKGVPIVAGDGGGRDVRKAVPLTLLPRIVVEGERHPVRFKTVLVLPRRRTGNVPRAYASFHGNGLTVQTNVARCE